METNTIITGIISPLIALIPTLILVWKSWEKKQVSLAVRIIRKKNQIQKAELYNKVRMEKLKLELKALEEEAEYHNRMSKWESGEISTKTNDLTDKTSELKQKGEQIIQKGTEKVNLVVGDLKDKVGKTFDQAKNLKNKFLGSDQKK